MRESKYNYCMGDHTGMVIYNAKTDGIVALTPELATLFEGSRGDFGKLEKLHPDLYSHLLGKGMLVGDSADEVGEYIRMVEQGESVADDYTITVNPTLACNMKCWYCYESHEKMPAMSAAVAAAVSALIRRVCTSGGVKCLNLSFFGGEPLLCFDNVVQPLLSEAARLCSANGLALHVHFTTNAYLLSEKVLGRLEGIDTSFQITIDGNENMHNSIRFTKSGEGTYATIIGNIRMALEKGFQVGVRFNYTAKTLPTFADVLSDFRSVPKEQRGLLNFNFQRIWQDCGKENGRTEEAVSKLEGLFEDDGFVVKPANDYFVPYCYADKKNTVVVNYNGDLYKCTARDFTPKNKEGVITADGDLVWNKRGETGWR